MAAVFGGLLLNKTAPVTETVDAAAVDYFLKIEGIPGESKDNKHKDFIDILSWSWGISRSGSGNGAGKVSSQDLTMTKFVDKASPKLFLACAKGEHIPEIKLFVSSADRLDYLKYTFQDVTCNSFNPSGDHGSAPIESISFSYQKIIIDYKPQDGAKKDAETIRAAWDFQTSSSF